MFVFEIKKKKIVNLWTGVIFRKKYRTTVYHFKRRNFYFDLHASIEFSLFGTVSHRETFLRVDIFIQSYSKGSRTIFPQFLSWSFNFVDKYKCNVLRDIISQQSISEFQFGTERKNSSRTIFNRTTKKNLVYLNFSLF